MADTADRFTPDALERLGFTGLEVGAGLAVAELLDISPWWGVLIAVAATLVKVLLAKHTGAKGTASALPAHTDPAGPGRRASHRAP